MPRRKISSLSLNQKLVLAFMLLGIVVACIGIPVAMITAFISGHDWFSFLSPPSTMTIPPMTNTPSIPTSSIPLTSTSATETLVPMNTFTASPIPPTNTPLPPSATFTATPEFYEAGVWVALNDNIYAKLHDNFESSANCNTQANQFAFNIELRNNDGLLFLVRFDTSSFHAEDDTGKKYKLLGAGVNNCFDVGVVNKQIGGVTWIRSKFEGVIPLNAHYIILTADSINGVKLVFRMNL